MGGLALWIRVDNGPFRLARRVPNSPVRRFGILTIMPPATCVLKTRNILSECTQAALARDRAGERGVAVEVLASVMAALAHVFSANSDGSLMLPPIRRGSSHPARSLPISERSAPSMSLDPDRIAVTVPDAGQKATSGFSTATIAIDPTSGRSRTERTETECLAFARRLRAQTSGVEGLPPPLQLRFVSGESHRGIARAAAPRPKPLPFEVKPHQLKFPTFCDPCWPRLTEMVRKRRLADLPDPLAFSDRSCGDRPRNPTGFVDAREDELLDEEATTSEPTRGLALFPEVASSLRAFFHDKSHCPILPSKRDAMPQALDPDPSQSLAMILNRARPDDPFRADPTIPRSADPLCAG